GFVQGDPLQSLDLFRNVMRKAYQHHGVKAGYFSAQYKYGGDPKRVVFGGESAGGSLSYTLALKVRDEFSHELPSPL
ncbi:hypothetical protein BGZ47_011860, partial [Haplosporangium gracile]